MLLVLLAYLAGALTIASPCILPVLPFVFARADQPFVRSGLPLLLGMALTFAAVATLAAVAGGWAVAANQYGRAAALVLLAGFGITLLFPHLADRMTQPLVRLGARLSERAGTQAGPQRPAVASFVLGVATGLLWAPCAGPVLGLILTGAALGGASAHTTGLLFAYAAGAATSLALALLVGGRVFKAMKRSLGASEWVRRGLGAAVLAGVVAIGLGLDTGALTQVSLASTASLEQRLLDKFHATPGPEAAMAAADPAPIGAADSAPVEAAAVPLTAPTAPVVTTAAGIEPTPSAPLPAPVVQAVVSPAAEKPKPLPVEGTMPALAGATTWLNSPPLTTEQLKGKVVLVDFWTYSCINCLRALPYVRAWADKYKDQGLVVIGVHAPEFAFEKQLGNVRQAVADLKVGYPVAVDNDYAIWRAFKNQYWPAHYFIDAQGRIRHHHFGEGQYTESEKVIQQLLAEAGRAAVNSGTVTVEAAGAQAASNGKDVRSPETYIGTERAEHFVSPGGLVADARHGYRPGMPKLNEWGLSGEWTVGGENAVLNKPGGGIVYRFQARDLHLVLGPGTGNKPVRFRLTLDGVAPGADHGVDIDETGAGTVTGQRLYQLVRQKGDIGEHTLEITFEDPGVRAYAFTFG